MVSVNILNEVQWKSGANIELENYTWIVAEAIRNGFGGSDDEDDNPSKWSFPGAFLYSLTVITTIGESNHFVIYVFILVQFSTMNVLL